MVMAGRKGHLRLILELLLVYSIPCGLDGARALGMRTGLRPKLIGSPRALGAGRE